MLKRRLDRGSAPPKLDRVVEGPELLAMRESLELVRVDPDVLDYVVALVGATRVHPQVAVGASPRGGLALVALSRGRAVLAGRDYVTPEDVKSVAVSALGHGSASGRLWVRRSPVTTSLASSWVRSPATPAIGAAPDGLR
jgi:MoxR-like ATPase